MLRVAMRGLLVIVVGAVATTVVPVGPLTPTVADPSAHACAPFEASIDGVPAVANPFDPAQLRVDVAFVGPDGAIIVMAGFFSQDHDRSLDGTGTEVRVPTGAPGWRVRFTPPRAGTWRWRPVVRAGGGDPLDVGERSFTCTPDPGEHGVVRRSPAHPDRLVFDDGTPFVAVGENLAWYGPGGTYDYDRWIGELARHGATWIRVWMPSWSMGLEWLRRDGTGAVIESSLGNYTTRLDRAWQLDRVIETARRHRIVVQLVLSNPEWPDNPYNAANGGPLAKPADMFTDPTARALFQRRLRYITARWGYATNLIWELWNEVDLSGGDVGTIVAWHDEMASFLAANDPARHLRTTSTFGYWDFEQPSPVYDALWASPQIDLVQLHVYGAGADHAVNFTTVLPPLVASARVRYGKPVIVGEAGVDFRGPDQTNIADPPGQGLHEMLWSGVFSGSAGTAMTWWWDSVIEAKHQYPRFDGIVNYLEGVGFTNEQFEPTALTSTAGSGAPLQTSSLHGANTTLVWLRNPDHWWHQPDRSPIAGATLSGLPAGTWRLVWYDPYTGIASNAATVTVAVAGAPIAVPTFDGELALHAEQTGPAPSPSSPTPSEVPAGGSYGRPRTPVITTAVPRFAG